MLKNRINLQVIIWTTLIGGFISSLVKSERKLICRPAWRDIAPAAHIDAWLGWLGINSHSLDTFIRG
jgi:putative membrane protein